MSTREVSAADLLSRDEIRTFTTPANAGGALAIAGGWLAIAGAFVLAGVWPHPLTFALAVVILGGRQLALAVMMHEAAHGTLFRTRWCNEQLADWLCGRPVPICRWDRAPWRKSRKRGPPWPRLCTYRSAHPIRQCFRRAFSQSPSCKIMSARPCA